MRRKKPAPKAVRKIRKTTSGLNRLARWLKKLNRGPHFGKHGAKY